MLVDVMSDAFKEQAAHEEMIARILSRPFKVPIPGYVGRCKYNYFLVGMLVNYLP